MDVLNVMCVAAALSVSAESMDGTTGEADTALQSDRMTPEVLWAMGEEFVWAEDNNTLYFTGVWHGRTMVYSTNLRGEVRPITTGNYDYAGISLMPGGDKLLAKRQSLSAPDDIYLITLPRGKKDVSVAQLTHENHWVLKPQNGVLWQRTFFRWLDRWLK